MIQEEDVTRPRPIVFARAVQAADAVAAVPVAPGQQAFSASVVVTYPIASKTQTDVIVSDIPMPG